MHLFVRENHSEKLGKYQLVVLQETAGKWSGLLVNQRGFIH